MAKQMILGIHEELTVDLFAGGGGWSSAFEAATGRHVDVAVNHDSDAISMHEANHPQAKHYQADVFEVCPHEATGGMPVGWLHLSPDCTHHSQAKGGQPRDRKIRALAWVAIRWAGQAQPRIISLENVKQILNWGPLIAKRCKQTGRVVKLDGSVAEKGERVPVSQQFLVPDPKRAGETWKRFVAILRGMGYTVESRRLVAADYGAPTTRDRLFMMARRDGEPIIWPEKTHFQKPARGQKKWRAAAECIDWSIEGRSIFNRQKPLADATMRRIARGVQRFVLNSPEPFLVQTGYGERNGQAPRVLDAGKPLGTIVAGGVKHAVVAPTLIQASHGEGRPGGVKRWGLGAKDARDPLNTVTTSGSGGHSVAMAYLAQMNGGPRESTGRELGQPMSTILNSGSHQQLVTAHLAHLRGNCDARDVEEPLHTISAGGQHHGVVTCELSPDVEAGALRVAAFLIRYYSEGGQWGDLSDPMDTITTKDRLGLVTVHVRGTPYIIVDIKLRMLEPHELYAAQGFDPTYIITHGHDGRKFSKSAQVRMCGNSVSPPPAAALVLANWNRQEPLRKAA